MIKLQPTMKGYIKLITECSDEDLAGKYAKKKSVEFFKYVGSHTVDSLKCLVKVLDVNPTENITNALSLYGDIDVDSEKGSIIITDRNTKSKIVLKEDSKLGGEFVKQLIPMILHGIDINLNFLPWQPLKSFSSYNYTTF